MLDYILSFFRTDAETRVLRRRLSHVITSHAVAKSRISAAQRRADKVRLVESSAFERTKKNTLEGTREAAKRLRDRVESRRQRLADKYAAALNTCDVNDKDCSLLVSQLEALGSQEHPLP